MPTLAQYSGFRSYKSQPRSLTVSSLRATIKILTPSGESWSITPARCASRCMITFSARRRKEQRDELAPIEKLKGLFLPEGFLLRPYLRRRISYTRGPKLLEVTRLNISKAEINSQKCGGCGSGGSVVCQPHPSEELPRESVRSLATLRRSCQTHVKRESRPY